MSSTENLKLTVVWFPAAEVRGPALGEPRNPTWNQFVHGITSRRRVGKKDGHAFVPARFIPEQDGRMQRVKQNLVSRTAIALDVETNKSGEAPPALSETAANIEHLGFAALLYTSHSHTPAAQRYRIVFPITEAVRHELPTPEVMAGELGISGVIDRSKLGAASLFYAPSAPSESVLGDHATLVLPGQAIDAAWLTERAEALLTTRQIEADRAAAEAHAAAVKRRAEKLAAGFNPDDSLIEKLRSRFDMESVLLAHGYAKNGNKWRHPRSQSGSFGADVKVFGGVERIYSHNGGDPLHAGNLPSWCAGVTAIDVIDVVTILDFGGDRTRALRELARRFNLSQPSTKKTALKTLSALLFRLIRQQAPQELIEARAFAEGERLGLTPGDVCRLAAWVAGQFTQETA